MNGGLTMILSDEERRIAIEMLEENIAGILHASREEIIQAYVETGVLMPSDVEEYRAFGNEKLAVYRRLVEHLKHEGSLSEARDA